MAKINFKNVITIFVAAFFLTGCLEAKFQLAEESRLPKWFDIHNDDRSEFTVKMEAYSTFKGWKTVVKLYKKGSFLPIQQISITSETNSLKKLNPKSIEVINGYPRYNAITVNNITDIVEHKKMEPIFYMTDDPEIWEELIAE